ncbi:MULTISPECIES: hypothetical protein [Bradyrhizobium]|uniref:hypothetical protein n=1 Tax=Bradyrhizobium TaxID=374 RepID=UPI0013E160E6|nr:hypothetical protein [Bradyrhizobium sp. 6(2017)]QIG91061.1 hypothetical protein G6P99_42315 [Bradyrhizobium sp. 6(2017)]
MDHSAADLSHGFLSSDSCPDPRAVDLAALRHVPTTRVHDLAGRLRCVKCSKAGKRPAAELLQLWQRCPIGDKA